MTTNVIKEIKNNEINNADENPKTRIVYFASKPVDNPEAPPVNRQFFENEKRDGLYATKEQQEFAPVDWLSQHFAQLFAAVEPKIGDQSTFEFVGNGTVDALKALVRGGEPRLPDACEYKVFGEKPNYNSAPIVLCLLTRTASNQPLLFFRNAADLQKTDSIGVGEFAEILKRAGDRLVMTVLVASRSNRFIDAGAETRCMVTLVDGATTVGIAREFMGTRQCVSETVS